MSTAVAEILNLYRNAEFADQSLAVKAIMHEWAKANPKSMLPSYWASQGISTATPPLMTPRLEAELKRRIKNGDDYYSAEEILKLIDTDLPEETPTAQS